MPGQLDPTRAAQLDAVVEKMLANGESDDVVQGLVNDFKAKFGTTAFEEEHGPHAPQTSFEKAGDAAMGVGDAAVGFVKGAYNTVAHPWETAKEIGQSHVDEAKSAYNSFANAKGPMDYVEGAGHTGAALLPFLGPVAANAGRDIGEGAGTGDFRKMGRGAANAALVSSPIPGAEITKRMPKSFGAIREVASKMAPENAGAMAGGFEALIHSGGNPFAGIAGAAAGYFGKKSITGAIKDALTPEKSKPGKAAPKASGGVTREQQINGFEPSEPSGGPTAAPRPVTPPKAATPPPAGATAKMRAPDYLKQDVVGYKPGAKFNTQNKTLSVPGMKGSQTSLLRGDESVMGLARELGLDVPEGGFEKYPQPEGGGSAGSALRQRASMSGQRARTRARTVK